MFDHDGRPLHVTWNYDRAEIIADAVVHALGIVLGSVGAVTAVVLAALGGPGSVIGAVSVYAVGLVALFSVSAAYNLWPISRTKWLLRRFDHACIFVLIAATYTPFIARFPDGMTARLLFLWVWCVALAGAAAKVLLPGRFDRLSIALCLLLGSSGLIAHETVTTSLPASTVALMAAGGLVYAGGVTFHVWEGLRFQNAVWHGFVLVASALFYGAVLDGVVLA